MIKAIFFDLYHTLIGYDPPREDAIVATLDRAGIKLSARSLRRPLVTADEFFYRETAKKPLAQRNEAETQNLWVKYQATVLKEAGIEPRPELIRAILADMQKSKFNLVLFEDVLPALSALRGKDLILGLISNADKDVTGLLEKLGVAPYMQVILTSQQAGASKPSPEIFRQGVKRAKLSPHEALYVGDQWVVDVQGARDAGLKALLLDRGGYFEEVPPDEKISSLSELPDRI